VTGDTPPSTSGVDADADPDSGAIDDERRARATIRTEHADPRTVAAAVSPDNTSEIDTRVESGGVVTTVEREDAGGLRSTVDDYLVNLDVAERTARTTTDHTTRQ